MPPPTTPPLRHEWLARWEQDSASPPPTRAAPLPPAPPPLPHSPLPRTMPLGDSTSMASSSTRSSQPSTLSSSCVISPTTLSSPPTRSSISAPVTPTLVNMAFGVVPNRHISLEQRYCSIGHGLAAKNSDVPDPSMLQWTTDENAAAKRRYSAASSVGSGSSSLMERWSGISAGSASTGRSSFSNGSTSPFSPRNGTPEDNLMSCEVKMPTSPPLMPLPQTSPKLSKVEVAEENDNFVVTVWLPHFNRDLITVSRRRTQALHIVADNYCGDNAGHFERLIMLEGDGDEGPSSCVKAEFVAESDTLVIRVLKRRQAKVEKATEKAATEAEEIRRVLAEEDEGGEGAPTSRLDKPTKSQIGMKLAYQAREKARRQAEEWVRLGKS